MRYYDWPERLFEAIRKAQGSEFKWGENDCALFVCDCIMVMTEVDYAAKFRGKYTTRVGAMKALKKLEDVKSLSELADKCLGEKIDKSHAHRGDVVLLVDDSVEALGIVAGSYAVFLAPNGIQTILLSKCVCAWKVK